MFYLKGKTSAIVYFLLLINSFIFQDIKAQIVGGEDILIEQAPYMVSIRIDNIHRCGGAIIGVRHILTAAHCLINREGGVVTIVTGTSRSYGNEGTIHRLHREFIHPQFARGSSTNIRNDIAILTVQRNIEFNRFAHKIDLPQRNTGTGIVVTLSGWGFLNAESEVISLLLQRAHVNVISNPICAARLRSEGTTGLFRGQLCTYQRPGVGACVGDSGSPLVANNEIIGVLSFGVIPCARGFPDVFSRVYEYKGWIEEVMAHS